MQNGCTQELLLVTSVFKALKHYSFTTTGGVICFSFNCGQTFYIVAGACLHAATRGKKYWEMKRTREIGSLPYIWFSFGMSNHEPACGRIMWAFCTRVPSQQPLGSCFASWKKNGKEARGRSFNREQKKKPLSR